MKKTIFTLVFVVLECFFVLPVYGNGKEGHQIPRSPQIQVKIQDQFESEQAKKLRQYQPDMAKFMRNMAPLPDEVFETNRRYLEKWQKETGQKPQVVLEGITFNRLTRLRVAEKADVFVLLQPTDMYTAKLGYYTTGGPFTVGKDHRFKTIGYELCRWIFEHRNFPDRKTSGGIWNSMGIRFFNKSV